MKKSQTILKNFLNQFPTTATCWSEATDELRTILFEIVEFRNEIDNDLIEGEDGWISLPNHRTFKTPSAWNTAYRNEITKHYNDLRSEYAIEETTRRMKEWTTK